MARAGGGVVVEGEEEGGWVEEEEGEDRGGGWTGGGGDRREEGRTLLVDRAWGGEADLREEAVGGANRDVFLPVLVCRF